MAEISVNLLILIPIFLPFLSAILLFGFKKWLKGFSGEIAAGIIIIVVAIIASLQNRLKSTTTGILYGVYNTTLGVEYGPPYGVQLRIDNFSGWFSLILNIVIIFILISESVNNRGQDTAPIQNSILLFIISGVNAAILSYDFFTLFLSWVLIGLALIILIAMKRRELDVKEGAIRSYIIIGLSMSFLLFAVILSYGVFGSLNFGYIQDNFDTIISSTRMNNLRLIFYFIISLTIVAFGLLANLFLLNFAMPKALENAPTSAQIFGSGIISSVAIVSLFKVAFTIFNPAHYSDVNYSFILIIIGVITALEGAFLTIYQVIKKDSEVSLTRILIYIAITSIGFSIIGMSSSGLSIALGLEENSYLYNGFSYGALNLLNLATCMFLTFIAKERFVQHKENVDDLRTMKGMAKEMPLTSVIFIIALFSLMGLMPTIGGVNIYLLIFNLIELNYIAFAVMIIIILLLLSYAFLILMKRIVFDKPDRESMIASTSLSDDLSLTTFIGLVLIIGLLFFGFMPTYLISNLIEGINTIFS